MASYAWKANDGAHPACLFKFRDFSCIYHPAAFRLESLRQQSPPPGVGITNMCCVALSMFFGEYVWNP